MTDDTFTLDLNELNELTIGEIEEIEERTGVALDRFMAGDVPKGKMLRALAYVTRRRTYSEFTWEDAGNLKVRFDDAPTPVDPTVAAGS